MTFNEITQAAVLKALENPRTIDLKQVDPPDRRVLDRLWASASRRCSGEVTQGLSAGRVQSFAMKMFWPARRAEASSRGRNLAPISGRGASGSTPAAADRRKKAEVGNGAKRADRSALSSRGFGSASRAQGVAPSPPRRKHQPVAEEAARRTDSRSEHHGHPRVL